MAAVWFRLRAELRSRWKAVIVVDLVAGLAEAVTLATAAGIPGRSVGRVRPALTLRSE